MPCWHAAPIARWPRFLIVPCGVLMAAAVLGRIEGIPTTTKADVDVYVGTGPRLGFELRLGSRLVGRLYGDALVSIKPQQARIGGMEVWHAPPMAGDVGGAVLALF